MANKSARIPFDKAYRCESFKAAGRWSCNPEPINTAQHSIALLCLLVSFFLSIVQIRLEWHLYIFFPYNNTFFYIWKWENAPATIISWHQHTHTHSSSRSPQSIVVFCVGRQLTNYRPLRGLRWERFTINARLQTHTHTYSNTGRARRKLRRYFLFRSKSKKILR